MSMKEPLWKRLLDVIIPAAIFLFIVIGGKVIPGDFGHILARQELHLFMWGFLIPFYRLTVASINRELNGAIRFMNNEWFFPAAFWIILWFAELNDPINGDPLVKSWIDMILHAAFAILITMALRKYARLYDIRGQSTVGIFN